MGSVLACAAGAPTSPLARLAVPCLFVLACKPEDPGPPEDTFAETRDVSVQFRALFSDGPFECSTQMTNVGTKSTTIRPNDMRVYVHDVALRDADSGDLVPVELTASAFQGQGVVLLDFEDGDGFCTDGTPELNDRVTGTVPGARYDGLSFTLGVPTSLNHGDPDTALAPLNAPGMVVNATTGWRHFKLDMTPISGGQPGWSAWIHAVSCTAGSGCVAENLRTWSFDTFDPDTQTVDLDLGNLLAASDLTANDTEMTPAGVVYETAPGCQSDPVDDDCAAIFARYGLTAAPSTFVVVP